jgi:hypothetical protein
MCVTTPTAKDGRKEEEEHEFFYSIPSVAAVVSPLYIYTHKKKFQVFFSFFLSWKAKNTIK